MVQLKGDSEANGFGLVPSWNFFILEGASPKPCNLQVSLALKHSEPWLIWEQEVEALNYFGRKDILIFFQQFMGLPNGYHKAMPFKNVPSCRTLEMVNCVAIFSENQCFLMI